MGDRMTWVDALVMCVILLSGLVGVLSGFVHLVLWFGAWFGAAWVALTCLPVGRPLVGPWISHPEWIDPVSYALLFFILLVTFLLLAKMVGGLVRSSVLGKVDRCLGLLFGVALGATFPIVAYVLAATIERPEQWPTPARDAGSLRFICEGAVWVAQHIPEGGFRPAVEPCTAPRQTALDPILSTSPSGRATDPPTRK
jgi:membrane protein required for colicin V production